LTPWPTLDPRLAIGDRVTCGDGTPAFLPGLLNNSPDALTASDAVTTALREFAGQSNRLSAPVTTGWRRVLVTSADALFVYTAPSGAPWYYAHLVTTGVGQSVAGWFFAGGGECRPEVDLGPDVRRAELHLDPNGTIDPKDRAIRLLVSELSCSSGRSPAGRIETPRVAYEADQILVVISIRKLPGEQDCQGGGPYAYTLSLTEPIGVRRLFDAAVLPHIPVERPST
jgi:hypothetical protein